MQMDRVSIKMHSVWHDRNCSLFAGCYEICLVTLQAHACNAGCCAAPMKCDEHGMKNEEFVCGLLFVQHLTTCDGLW